MGRGDAMKGYKTTQELGAERAGQARQLETGTLIPGYENLMTQGYTPEQKAGMTTAGMGSTASAFDTASKMAENEAARTRNAAAPAAQQGALARAKGEAMGTQAAGLQAGFADREQANRLAGLAGLQQLYGTDTGAMESMYGLGPGYLEQANKPPWYQELSKAGIGAGGAVATGGVSRGGRWTG